MDWALVWSAVVFAAALGVAFACALGGILIAIAGSIGQGFMARQNRAVKFIFAAVPLTAGVAIAITATVLFMRVLPR